MAEATFVRFLKVQYESPGFAPEARMVMDALKSSLQEVIGKEFAISEGENEKLKQRFLAYETEGVKLELSTTGIELYKLKVFLGNTDLKNRIASLFNDFYFYSTGEIAGLALESADSLKWTSALVFVSKDEITKDPVIIETYRRLLNSSEPDVRDKVVTGILLSNPLWDEGSTLLVKHLPEETDESIKEGIIQVLETMTKVYLNHEDRALTLETVLDNACSDQLKEPTLKHVLLNDPIEGNGIDLVMQWALLKAIQSENEEVRDGAVQTIYDLGLIHNRNFWYYFIPKLKEQLSIETSEVVTARIRSHFGVMTMKDDPEKLGLTEYV